jgi:Flp pilus assembly protein TadG
MKRWTSDRGAAAVEFALVLPILVAMLVGIMEFGHYYNAQLTLTNAAREGARSMAITKVATTARSKVQTAADSLSPAPAASAIAVSPAACTAGATVTVTVRYYVPAFTGLYGPGLTLTGKAAMRCGG